MAKRYHPTLGNGKICYVQIPADDVQRSANFYKIVFGWKIKSNGAGRIAFDDGVNQVSGTWVTGRIPATDPSLLIYIMVDSVDDAMKNIVANGGKIVEGVGADAPEITARFADPAGNVFGIYQEQSTAKP